MFLHDKTNSFLLKEWCVLLSKYSTITIQCQNLYRKLQEYKALQQTDHKESEKLKAHSLIFKVVSRQKQQYFEE